MMDVNRKARERLVQNVKSVECLVPDRCGLHGWRKCEVCQRYEDFLLYEMEKTRSYCIHEIPLTTPCAQCEGKAADGGWDGSGLRIVESVKGKK